MALTSSRITLGDVARNLGQEMGRHGHPLGRSFLERLLRDYSELQGFEWIAGSRTWPAEAIEVFRGAVRRDRGVRR